MTKYILTDADGTPQILVDPWSYPIIRNSPEDVIEEFRKVISYAEEEDSIEDFIRSHSKLYIAEITVREVLTLARQTELSRNHLND